MRSHISIASWPSSRADPAGFREDKIKSYDEIEEMLAAYVAHRTGKPAGEIDRERRFDRLGLDSADAVALVGELEDFVDRPLSAYLPYQHPTIHQLARRIADGDS
jgi:acyl carrier protein